MCTHSEKRGDIVQRTEQKASGDDGDDGDQQDNHKRKSEKERRCITISQQPLDLSEQSAHLKHSLFPSFSSFSPLYRLSLLEEPEELLLLPADDCGGGGMPIKLV